MKPPIIDKFIILEMTSSTTCIRTCSCKLCLKNIHNSKDLNLVHSFTAKFNPSDEIQQLTFSIPSKSIHVCRVCRALLLKRNNARRTIQEIDSKIFRLVHEIDDRASEDQIKISVCNELDGGSFTECIPAKDNIHNDEIDLAITTGIKRMSNNVVIEQVGKKNVLELQKPGIVFKSDRKKIQILDAQIAPSADQNYHDYCVSPTKSSVLSIFTTAIPKATQPTLLIPPSLTQPISVEPQTSMVFKLPCKSSDTKSHTSKHTRHSSVATQTQSSLPLLWFNNNSAETSALISVRWPSSERHKLVPQDITNLAVNILKGSHQEIAKAAWNHTEIRKHFLVYFQKAIAKEAEMLCSEKFPSILRMTRPQELMDFTFDKLEQELRERCPIFYSVLKSVAFRPKRMDVKKPEKPKQRTVEQGNHRGWKAAVCLAASTCFFQRSVKLHALETMMGMLEDGEKRSLPKCILKLRYIFVPE